MVEALKTLMDMDENMFVFSLKAVVVLLYDPSWLKIQKILMDIDENTSLYFYLKPLCFSLFPQWLTP